MTNIQITATWSFSTPFHLGTGLSGVGVDRTVRSFLHDPNDDDDDPSELERPIVRCPDMSGEAVKGSIRGSAERIVRWLIHPIALPEEKNNSLPRHPALLRIFAPAHAAFHAPSPRYRFSAPSYNRTSNAGIGAIASTAIHADRGMAIENTLRVIEQSSPHAFFSITIHGRSGNWDDPDSPDYLDLVLLLAAFAATTHVGGKKGNGMGETAIFGLELSPVPLPPFDAAILQRLRDRLIQEPAVNA